MNEQTNPTTPPSLHQAVAPCFDRRWSLARDGFGLQRDDENGNYVHIDDAIDVLHAALATQAVAEPTHFCMAWGANSFCAICGKDMPVSTGPAELAEPYPDCPNAFICAGRCTGDRCADAMQPLAPQAVSEPPVGVAVAAPEAKAVKVEAAAWQERQEVAPGRFGEWYERRSGWSLARDREIESGGIRYQFRPLYAEPLAAPVAQAVVEALTDEQIEDVGFNLLPKVARGEFVNFARTILALATPTHQAVEPAPSEFDPSLGKASEAKGEPQTSLTAPAAAPLQVAQQAHPDTVRLDWLLPNLHPANFSMGFEWDTDDEFLTGWRKEIDAAMSIPAPKSDASSGRVDQVGGQST